MHDALLVILPVFTSIRAIPLDRVVMSLVSETYGNPISAEGPKLLDQAIVELAAPLLFEKSYDGFSPSRTQVDFASGYQLHSQVRPVRACADRRVLAIDAIFYSRDGDSETTSSVSVLDMRDPLSDPCRFGLITPRVSAWLLMTTS